MPRGVYKRTPDMNTGKYVRTQETKDKISKSKLGHIVTQEARDKMSKSHTGKKHPHTQETKDKISNSHIGMTATQESKDKMSVTRLKNKEEQGYLNSIEARKKISKAKEQNWKDPEYKKKQSESHIELWKDPIYRDSQLKAIFDGCDKSPNEPEKLLFKIVDKLFPGNYLLNVNGEHLTLEGKRPDIVNLEDKKCIEHQGDYWHANPEFCKLTGTKFVKGVPIETIRKTDKERLDILNSYGYQTLIVWEHELQDLEKLEASLLVFQEGG